MVNKRSKLFRRKLTRRDEQLIIRRRLRGQGPTQIAKAIKNKISVQGVSMWLMRHKDLVSSKRITVNITTVTSNKEVKEPLPEQPSLNEPSNMLTMQHADPPANIHPEPPESVQKASASPKNIPIPYELDLSITGKRRRGVPEGTELYSDPDRPGEYL